MIEVLEAGRLSRVEIAKLKGTLTFAEGHLFGRCCRASFNSLTQHLFGHPADSVLSEDCVSDLRAFKSAFGKGKVKCVDANSRDIVYLFTDAHYEGGAGGLCAVLYDEQGRVASWLGQPLSTEECAALNVQDAEQIITELEALTVLMSLRLWRERVVRKNLLVFVDNEGARGAGRPMTSFTALLMKWLWKKKRMKASRGTLVYRVQATLHISPSSCKKILGLTRPARPSWVVMRGGFRPLRRGGRLKACRA